MKKKQNFRPRHQNSPEYVCQIIIINNFYFYLHQMLNLLKMTLSLVSYVSCCRWRFRWHFIRAISEVIMDTKDRVVEIDCIPVVVKSNDIDATDDIALVTSLVNFRVEADVSLVRVVTLTNVSFMILTDRKTAKRQNWILGFLFP